MRIALAIGALVVIAAIGYCLWAIRDWERKGGL
jgi:hypothetical protein